MLDRLVDWTTQLGAWAYVILALGATCETAAFFAPIAPGETLVVFGGVVASRPSLSCGGSRSRGFTADFTFSTISWIP